MLIETFVPKGKLISAALNAIIGSFLLQPGDKGFSLDEIKEDIASLRDVVVEQYQELKNEIASLAEAQREIAEKLETKITDQTTIAQKGDSFDDLLSSLKEMSSQIETIQNNTKLSIPDKAVEKSLLFGRNDKWTESSNLYNRFNNFLNTITGKTFSDMKGRDLLELVYDYYSQDSMFTGETRHLTALYTNQIVCLALYAYSICAECLKAQQVSCSFLNKDVKKLNSDNRKIYDQKEITYDLAIATAACDDLNDKMFKLEYSDVSFADRIKTFYDDDTNRHIYTNQGKTNLTLSDKIVTRNYENGEFVKDGSPYDDWTIFHFKKYFDTTENFGSEDRIRIVEHAKTSFPGSMREYLTALGYDMTKVPENTWFYMAANVFESDSGNPQDPRTGYVDYYENLCFKAVNIDDADYNVNDSVVVVIYDMATYHDLEVIEADSGSFITIELPK